MEKQKIIQKYMLNQSQKADQTAFSFVKKENGNFVPIIGILILVSVVGFVSYYFGTQNNQTVLRPEQSENTSKASQLPTTLPAINAEDDLESFQSDQLNGISFFPFLINYPKGWSSAKEGNEEHGILNFKLSKKDHHLYIQQGAMGGAVCLFNQNVDFDGPANDYRGKEYIEISSNVGLLRRVKSTVDHPGRSVLVFCTKSPTSQLFNSLTPVGNIYYDLPEKYDLKILSEMDEIMKNLSAIK